MEQTKELLFMPKPITLEITSVNRLKEMFVVGGQIKYDEKGEPADYKLSVEAQKEQIERFLINQRDAFPKGGATTVTIDKILVSKHNGTVENPWQDLIYNFAFRAIKTDESNNEVWSVSYRVNGTQEEMKLTPREFNFSPSAN